MEKKTRHKKQRMGLRLRGFNSKHTKPFLNFLSTIGLEPISQVCKTGILPIKLCTLLFSEQQDLNLYLTLPKRMRYHLRYAQKSA